MFSTHRKGHGIHSPFLFSLIENVFRNKTSGDIVLKIEGTRKRLLSDRRKISVTDFGTGKGEGNNEERVISKIARHSAVPQKYGQLLLNLSSEYGGECMLELGTSFGIGTMYLAAGSPGSKVYTVEGCPEISGVARENFTSCGFRNIGMLTGRFADELIKLKEKGVVPGLVFIDGDHRKVSVLENFEFLCGMSDERTVMIFDDIHMNREMGEAWEIISKNEKVTLAVDTFRMGIVFFRKGLTPSFRVIRY